MKKIYLLISILTLSSTVLQFDLSLTTWNTPWAIMINPFAITHSYAQTLSKKIKKPAKVIIENNKFYLNGLAGMRIKGSIPISINSCDFFENGRGGMDIEKEAKVTITDSKYSRNRRGGINIEDAEQIIIKNSAIYDNWRGGMRLQKEKSLDDSVMSVHLENNRIYMNAEGGIRSQPYPGAKIDLKLLKNEIFENMQAGVRVENLTTLTASHNRFHHNETAGIIAHESTLPPTLDIYRNIFNFNRGPGIHIYTGINGKIGISNNWIYDNQQSGIILAFRETLFNTVIDIDIMHNTIVGNGSLDQGAGVRNDSNGRLRIMNNIIAYNYITGIRSAGCEDDYSYNLMYANGSVANCCDDPYSAPFWVEKVQYAGCSGRGKGELITNPFFVDPDNYDFDIKEHSPAKNAAIIIDGHGTSNNPYAKDIGATGGPYADL